MERYVEIITFVAMGHNDQRRIGGYAIKIPSARRGKDQNREGAKILTMKTSESTKRW